MVLTWNLNQQINLTTETKQRQKIDDDVISANDEVIFVNLEKPKDGLWTQSM